MDRLFLFDDEVTAEKVAVVLEQPGLIAAAQVEQPGQAVGLGLRFERLGDGDGPEHPSQGGGHVLRVLTQPVEEVAALEGRGEAGHVPPGVLADLVADVVEGDEVGQPAAVAGPGLQIDPRLLLGQQALQGLDHHPFGVGQAPGVEDVEVARRRQGREIPLVGRGRRGRPGPAEERQPDAAAEQDEQPEERPATGHGASPGGLDVGWLGAHYSRERAGCQARR